MLPAGVEAVRGDVTDPPSVAAAVAGCEVVFNAMGLPEQWLADERLFDRVNAEGTRTVARAAREAGVRRLVHTSTEDVFHAEPRRALRRVAGRRLPEGHGVRALQAARRAARAVAARRPRGRDRQPGRRLRARPERERLLRQGLRSSRWCGGGCRRCRPGGLGLVYVDGLAAGHLLAAERGRDGERYILCDTHVSLRDLAKTVVREAGRGRVPPTLPVPLARGNGRRQRGALARDPAPAAALARPAVLLHLERAPDRRQGRRRSWAGRRTPLAEGVRRTLDCARPAQSTL